VETCTLLRRCDRAKALKRWRGGGLFGMVMLSHIEPVSEDAHTSRLGVIACPAREFQRDQSARTDLCRHPRNRALAHVVAAREFRERCALRPSPAHHVADLHEARGRVAELYD
jgi:hypothetical protein